MSATKEQKERMNHLIRKLNQATTTYDEGCPLISDKEWDDMYFELDRLEKETGVVQLHSPTHNIMFETVSELKKVKHNHPMLSLEKTKNLDEIKSFLGNKNWIIMGKMDGLTCSLKYINGELVGAETRGNGEIGEDILHNVRVLDSVPKHINIKDEVIIDGEIICTYKNFEAFQESYKNPRNFASGSIRLLDSKECFNRHLTFIAWDVIKGIEKPTLGEKLTTLEREFFNIVPFIRKIEIRDEGEPFIFDKPIEEAMDDLQKFIKIKSYPIDGLVFKYDKISEYDAMGRTDHHFKGGMAFKFYDETYSTRLRYIHWTMGRTGVLTPVAVFDPVEIDGTEVTRASLHNVSIMRETLGECAYDGEPLEVYKSNQIIPQIYSAGPKFNYGEVVSRGGVSANDAPEHCPICGGSVSYEEENGVIRLYCDNPDCEGKLMNRLDHFCGKKGLDIKGLSKATLEKLIDWQWVNDIEDIFKLYRFEELWTIKPNFGKASVNKILKAIEEAKNCSTDKFICALGIPLIGKVASTALTKVFGNYQTFRKAIEEKDEKLYSIDGIGEVMINNLLDFDYEEADRIFNNYINEKCAAVPFSNGNELEGMIFVITGKLHGYKNRDELKSLIESKGGKVTGSVTKNTTYLINNDTDSTSAKNVTAKKLNIPIISEEMFERLASGEVQFFF